MDSRASGKRDRERERERKKFTVGLGNNKCL